MVTDLHTHVSSMKITSNKERSFTLGTASQTPTLIQNPESDLRDRLCTPLSSPSSDYPVAVDPGSSSTSTSSTSSLLSNAQESSHTSDSSALIVQRPRFKEDLNWCDSAEMVKNLALFDDDQQSLIRSITIKHQDFPDGFDKGNYFESIYPIIASGFLNADKIVYCGAQFSSGKRPCRLWHLCSRCAYYCGMNSSLRYGPAFNKADFSHLTCSFDGGLPLDSTNSADLRTYWLANAGAVRRAFNEGFIEGAYIVHELAIIRFLPLRVLPHSHILVSGDALTVDRLNTISTYIAETEGVDLVPSLRNRALNTRTELESVIKYQTKAIKLQEPYTSALIQCGRHRLRELNLEMREFLDSYSAAVGQFQKIVRIGNLHPQRQNSYIGSKVSKGPNKTVREMRNRGSKENRV